jgi:DNA-binding NarL/FixJ family response regulator
LESRDQVALRPARAERKPPPRAVRHMILVEPRALFRECLSDRLNESVDQSEVAAYASLSDVEFSYEKANSVLALLISVPSGDGSVREIAEAVSLAQRQLPQVPIVVITDSEELMFVRKVMSFGIQGLIPTSFDFMTFREAIEFVRAGGTFVPASTMLGLERQRSAGREHGYTKNPGSFSPDESRHSQTGGSKGMGAVRFTRRELDVLGQLRKGKSNKLIARELNIGEGTVKLYLQRIMRKLHVHNRTQAALTVTDILSGPYSG